MTRTTAGVGRHWSSPPVRAAHGLPQDRKNEGRLKPQPVPEPVRTSILLTGPWIAFLVLIGAGFGLGVVQAVKGRSVRAIPTAASEVETVAVETKRFDHTLRVAGTVGATNFAMIRAPRMRGGRDRGGGGGGSLTIESLAQPGSFVQAGDVVAVFESKRTEDFLDNYRSNLAQARTRAASRMASLLISSETLRQSHRKAEAEADKADLDLRTAEVKSQIQAEILGLQARQHRASARQLQEEVRLSEIADIAAHRTLEIDVERAERRLQRTQSDLERMRIRSPVSGLVVVESVIRRDSISQAAEGDQINPGSYFLRIVDLSSMALFAEINQADTSGVEIGSPVSVELDAYPGTSFEGRVAAIGAIAVSAGSTGGGRGSRGGSRGSNSQWVRQVPVQIEILDADHRIKPDLSASADILLRSRDDALVVPRAAIASGGSGYVVWVQRGDKFEVRPVEVGLVSDTQATVESGLREGDVIAAQPVTGPNRVVARSSALQAR